MQVHLIGQQACDGGLAGTRRPPENHRRQPAGCQHAPQWTIALQQMVLPDHFVQHPGSQAVGQRPIAFVRQSGRLEQIAHPRMTRLKR